MLRYFSNFFKKKETSRTYKPVILVTGCSSGIGLALAHILYRHTEYRVVITAREKGLAKLSDVFTFNDRFKAMALDVTSDSDRLRVVKEIIDLWGGVDILINNAGISYRSVIEHMTERDEKRQMATNYLGPMGLIRLVLPNMRLTGRGKIINVSSVSGMLAMPTMASYSASKYALEGASEALWYEMRPFGVSVTLIQPGFIRSNSFENVYYSEYSNPQNSLRGPYCDFYTNMSPFIAFMMKHSFTTADDVAKQILRVIKKQNPPLWIPATLDAKVFYYIRRILPRRLLLPFLYWCLPNAKTWSQAYSHKRY